MPTSGSIEAKLKSGLELRGMSTEQFAEVCRLEGIANASRRTLDRVFRDEKTLGGDTAEKLWSLWSEIELVQFWSYVLTGLPIRLDFSNGAKTHEVLLLWRERMGQELKKNSSGSSTALADNHTAEEQAEVR